MKRLSLLCCLCFFLASCSHKPARVAVAPAPPVKQEEQPVPEGTPPEVAAEEPESRPESSPNPEVEVRSIPTTSHWKLRPELPAGTALRITTGAGQTAKFMT